MRPATRIHTNAARSNARTADKPSARFVVGDYVGRAPGEAAYAVWRAGLLARLDRLAGHGPVPTARIAAQQPEPGQALGRRGVVTLFMVGPEEDDVETAEETTSRRRDSFAASENALELGASRVCGDELVTDLCLCALALVLVTSRVVDENLRSIAHALRQHVLEAEQQARALLALTLDAATPTTSPSRDRALHREGGPQAAHRKDSL